MISERLALTSDSLVVELASNDGYLLQHFLPKGIPVLGIDPAANVARAAEERGVQTLVEFFGVELAQRLVDEGRKADLVLGNNVLAQVPDLNDFVHGVSHPARGRRHRHVRVPASGPAARRAPVRHDLPRALFGYFSLFTIREVFAAHGLTVIDVEELPTHGGSLRVYAAHDNDPREPTDAVRELLAREESEGLRDPERYRRFALRVSESKRALLELLIELRRDGKQVVGYGAPGKGNTLLNYCGIRTDFLDYTVDRNPYKHGRFTPGTHIPIHPPERIAETRPDAIVILPWNLAREISAQLAYTEEWGAKLIVPIPTATFVEPGSTHRLSSARALSSSCSTDATR